MSKIRIWLMSLFLLILFVFLSGCYVEGDVISSPPAFTESSNPTEITSSFIPERTKTPVPNGEILNDDHACISLDSRNIDVGDFQDSILVELYKVGDIIFDFSATISISDIFGFITVSPDLEKIAYYEPESSILSILDSSGTVQKNHYLQQGLRLAEWVSEDRLLFFLGDEEPDSAVIYNITSFEKEIIPLDFPQISLGENQPGANWYRILGQYNRLVFDPIFSIVLYPSADNLYNPYGDLIIWGITEGLEIGRIPGIDRFTTKPQFSQDGETFVTEVLSKRKVAEADETSSPYDGSKGNLILVDIEGNISYLTDFQSDIRIYHYSWSPDGNKIAFWMNNKKNSSDGGLLGIMELPSKSLTSYCIWGFGKILWSPNGKYLLVNSQKDYKLNDFPTVSIISLEDNWRSDIFEEAEAIGWLIRNDK